MGCKKEFYGLKFGNTELGVRTNLLKKAEKALKGKETLGSQNKTKQKINNHFKKYR